MASIVIGSKSGIFRLKKTTWQCMTELESDVLIEVEEFSFLLHKFPLINASTVLAKIITKFSVDDRYCAFPLDDIPGGARSFELIAKFCYGEKIEITSSNVVSILCAAYKLDMNEDCLNGNLISQTETFLTDKIVSKWKESMVALLSCEPVLRYAEEFNILSKCLDSLASKVTYGKSSCLEPETWNGIVCLKDTKDLSGAVLEWWYDDICSLSLYLFKRFIQVLNEKEHDPVDISRAVIYYASNHRIRADTNSTGDWSADERILLEEIVDLLPKEKGATSTKVLLNMLSASIMLNANETCIETLEKRVGTQLDEATVEDLLVLNSGGGGKAVRNVDCIMRLIKQFMEDNAHENEITRDSTNDECLMVADSLQCGKIVVVAKLVDGYLAKIAEDSNLKLQQFLSLASAIPRSARPSGDDLYHAISAYLEYHPQLSDGQKEQLCQLIDVRKLSRDLCRDVVQNENLPIRVIVKALLCEMLDLKKALVDCRDGNNTVTEAENTTEDEVDSTDEKVLTESKGTFSRIWYRERRWYRLLSSERDESSKETKETEKARERRWYWFLSSEHECPKEIKESEKAKGEKVMCQFLMSKKIWSVRRVKALLASSKQ